TQIWIATRYFQSISILIIFLTINNNIHSKLYDILFQVSFISLLSSIFILNSFPDAYFQMTGLTSFKIISEYIISSIFLINIALIYYQHKMWDKKMINYFYLFLFSVTISELVFTLYTNVNDIWNFIGHILKIIAYYSVYNAIVVFGYFKVQKTLIHEIKRSNEVLDEFAKIVSHDLKNLLSSIIGNAQLLEEMIENDDTDIQDLLQDIVNLGFKMDELLGGIFQQSKIGFFETSVEIIQSHDEVHSIIKSIPLQNENIIIDKNLPTIMYSKIHFTQIIQNLLFNSIQHGEANEIQILSSDKNEYWEFEVKDNGKGIPEHQKNRLFKSMLKNLYSVDSKNYGIGLIIVKKIVNLYNGEIWLKSIPDKETSIYFTIPKKKNFGQL
ncbi:MAG: ATP-binding protein, partial [Candidatus Heimdallarchaeota archaeon]|nr:ATP-binding protein [Candidatus Heimdallarchaeota archaeon]